MEIRSQSITKNGWKKLTSNFHIFRHTNRKIILPLRSKQRSQHWLSPQYVGSLRLLINIK
jgi:hypothetical protein